MKRLILACAVATLLIAAFAPTALATTTKIPFTFDEVVVAEPVPGEMTIADGVVSLRGAVWLATTTGTPAIEGTDTIYLNFDLDLATGSGELWGTDVLQPSASPGGSYRCTWHGTFVDFSWSGKGVCHGQGTLDGWQLRYTIRPAGEGYHVQGSYFLPGD